MRRMLLALAGGVALAGCGWGATISASSASQYRDLEAGFSLTIPPGWQATHGYGDVDLLLQPQADSSSTRISVQWDQRTDNKPVSLDDYAAFRITRLGHFAKQRELISQQRAALNEAQPQALQLEYQYQIGPGHKVHTRSWLMVSEHSQYTLSLTAPPDQFAAMEQAWQQVEKNFRLIP